MLATAEIFLFEDFRLDRREGLFRRDERGIFVPVGIGPRALDVLAVLVERAGSLVTKEEIMAAVWGRTVVENANLTVQISALRRILDEGRTEGSCIQTAAARGYRFVVPVIQVERDAPSPLTGDTPEATGATRRLIAILAADVAGYSRLMGEDEEGTLARLKAHRRDLVDPKIGEYRGRIVKTTGDGLLVEFGSVVAAVRCAAEIQRAMLERDRDVPEEQRIRFRIGVNLGDVIVDGDDIFGDGVNIAARLEALAESGGVCVSHTVRDQIHDKLPYALDDLGEQFVKNIARPVRAYALTPETIVGLLPAGVARGVAAAPRRRAPLMIAAGAAAALIVAGGTAWWAWPMPRSPTAGLPIAAAMTPPLVAPRLSIVVLPFANLSNDPEQEYFADGITDDLTTDLSRLQNVLVISRSTAFTYKRQRVDTKQLGRELGVRYVLEGSVRRSGNQVRVNAQLIDAATNTHLWADRFDHDVGDLFAIQNEITSRIANTLGWELIGAETARPAEEPDALDYLLRGRAALQRSGGARDKAAEAVDLFQHVVALGPSSVEAQGRLANALVNLGFSKDPAGKAADLQRAEDLLAQALATSPGDSYAHFVKGKLLRLERRCEEAIPEFEISLAANRNNPFALVEQSMCKYLTGGSDQEAIALTEQAIRLSPRDPSRWWWYTWIGYVHLLQSRVDEAIAWLEKGHTVSPRAHNPYFALAAAYGFKGERERARADLAEAQRLIGSDRYSTVARVRANSDLNTPAVSDGWETVILPGMRAAGMPEE